MSTGRTGRVLVATSGSTASRSAIAYAAREAESRGLSLELVHVVTPGVPVGPYGAVPDVAVREAGREVLARGEETARRIAPYVDVTTAMLIGSRPDAIVDRARDADLVVVGAPPHDLIGRLWTGSTVAGVAARSTCPVVIVRTGRQATAHEVLVGLKSVEHADQLLATAFAVAIRSGSTLRVLHAWQMLSPYENAVAERLPIPAWELEEGRAIEAMLVDLRMAHPNVPVRVDLAHGQPAYTLVEASRGADLLVISRPVHGGYVHHLGATARTVIREAHCPVLVVPPGDRPDDDTIAGVPAGARAPRS
jgi:nucleotide-binding universal stress UspA family protein